MLTPKRKAVLEFLVSYDSEKRYSPTMREIADHFGKSSVATPAKILDALESGGYIRRIGCGYARNIRVLDAGRRAVNGFQVKASGRFSLSVITDRGQMERAGDVSELPAALEEARKLL